MHGTHHFSHFFTKEALQPFVITVMSSSLYWGEHVCACVHVLAANVTITISLVLYTIQNKCYYCYCTFPFISNPVGIHLVCPLAWSLWWSSLNHMAHLDPAKGLKAPKIIKQHAEGAAAGSAMSQLFQAHQQVQQPLLLASGPPARPQQAIGWVAWEPYCLCNFHGSFQAPSPPNFNRLLFSYFGFNW